MNTNSDRKHFAPATQGNREAILEVLLQVLPANGTISEIASGTGEQAVFFVPHLAPRKWLPSDPNPILRNSIAAWSEEFKSENLYPPIDLDAQLPTWPMDKDTLSIGQLPL